jgi:hypothetical protein
VNFHDSFLQAYYLAMQHQDPGRCDWKRQVRWGLDLTFDREQVDFLSREAVNQWAFAGQLRRHHKYHLQPRIELKVLLRRYKGRHGVWPVLDHQSHSGQSNH